MDLFLVTSLFVMYHSSLISNKLVSINLLSNLVSYHCRKKGADELLQELLSDFSYPFFHFSLSKTKLSVHLVLRVTKYSSLTDADVFTDIKKIVKSF